MIVYALQYDDGDYYCEGDHVLGIYTTEYLADVAKEAHKLAKNVTEWDWTYSVAKYTVDEMPEETEATQHIHT